MTPSTISVPKQFSEGSPAEWFQRFEICCTANGWEDETKAKRLPTLLEGEALAAWLELSEAKQKEYKDAKAKMLERMQFVSMDDFHRRQLLPGESLSVFIRELKGLMDQAMLDADAQTRKQPLIHQFLTGIPVEVSKQLRAAGEIEDLDRLIQGAKLLMTLDCREKTATVEKQQMDTVEALKEQVTALTEQVAALTTTQRSHQPASLLCFQCINLGTCNGIARTNLDAVTYVEGMDILQVSDVRETGMGHLDWAWGVPNDSKPFKCTQL